MITIAIGAGSTAAIAAFIGGLGPSAGGGADLDTATRLTRASLLLMIVCGIVLLVAAGSVAGMLLSRASSHRVETAVKIALGATHRRLAVECLVDSLIVSVSGGVVGVLGAWWTMHLVPVLFFAEDAEQLIFSPNVPWLAAAACAAIGAITICAMAPMLAVPHREPMLVLKRNAPATSNASRRLRTGLVIGQIALCVVLIIVAGVVREDLHDTLRTPRGQLLGSLLVAKVRVGGSRYLEEAKAKVERIAGVTGAGWIETLPGARASAQTFAIEPPPTEDREIRLDFAPFRPLERQGRLRAVAGRQFSARDRPEACPVALLNDVASRRYFDGDALGRSIQVGDGSRLQIVGILAQPGEPHDRSTLYYSETQRPGEGGLETPQQVAYAQGTSARRSSTTLDVNTVSAAYFDVFRDPPIAGRAFTLADRPGGCRVGVITESATSLFEGEAVGGALIDARGQRVEIVGVVRTEALGAAQQAPRPMLFLPIEEPENQVLAFAVRTNDTSASLAPAIRLALQAVPGGVVSTVTTLESLMSRTALASERIATTLVSVSVLTALIVSLGGVHTLMADLVVRRRRELALRMALGASARQVMGALAREALQLAAWGVAVGVGVAAIATPLLGAWVVRPRLPTLEAVVTACVATVLLLALSSALPGWRAVRVDPRVVMRDG